MALNEQIPAFSRARTTSDGGDISELRINIPRDLMAMIDAIALARNSDRTKLTIEWMSEKSLKVSHEAIVLARMVHGNPMLSEQPGKASE
jgi:hypothetical protein